MNAREALKAAFPQTEMICNAYLGDLTDEEILARPVDGANHIAWQLGHLITAENGMVEQVCPGSMPTLPEGFKEQHGKETSSSDDAAAFCTKDEYLKLAAEQRAATRKALDSLADEDLDKPAPEALQRIAPTVAGVFSMQPVHWLMHAGQWAVTRRKLGREPLF
ncbi:MAG: DinB family protein [Planctomycetaceae bacterium]